MYVPIHNPQESVEDIRAYSVSIQNQRKQAWRDRIKLDEAIGHVSVPVEVHFLLAVSSVLPVYGLESTKLVATERFVLPLC